MSCGQSSARRSVRGVTSRYSSFVIRRFLRGSIQALAEGAPELAVLTLGVSKHGSIIVPVRGRHRARLRHPATWVRTRWSNCSSSCRGLALVMSWSFRGRVVLSSCCRGLVGAAVAVALPPCRRRRRIDAMPPSPSHRRHAAVAVASTPCRRRICTLSARGPADRSHHRRL